MFRWGSKANHAVNNMTSSVDGSTGRVASEAAQKLALAVRLLRWPSLALVILPLPPLLATVLIAVLESGALSVIAGVVAALEFVVWGLFAWRRQRILLAVSDQDALATELGIAVAMSGRVDEARGVLTRLTTTSGTRLFDRLKALWSGVRMGPNWITQIGDLPRAKWFFPPSIGYTVTSLTLVLWLIPISAVVTFFLLVASIAN